MRIKAERIDAVRQVFMGIEGIWRPHLLEAVQEIIQGRIEFTGRVTRGAQDEVNSLLNYGYGILYSQVWVRF